MNRRSLTLHCAADRAHWLTELAKALDQASQLARELDSERGGAEALRERIRTLRREVDAIRAL